MKNININNYEAFLIDYLEHNLSKEGRKMVEVFLAEHPDIAAEFEMLQNLPALESDIQYAGKSELLKDPESITGSKDQDYLIAILEKDAVIPANLDEKQTVELSAYQKTKLVAPANITFPDKNKLYQYSIGIRTVNQRILSIISAAAAIALVFWTAVQFRQNYSQQHTAQQFKPTNTEFIQTRKIQQSPSQATTIAGIKHINNEKTIKNEPAWNELLSEPTRENIAAIELAKPVQNLDISKKAEIVETPQIANIEINLLKNAYKIKWDETNREIAREIALKKINERIVANTGDEKNLFWTFAEFGVDKLSRATGREMEFKNKYDESGNIKVLAFSAENFAVKKNMY